MGKSSHTNVYLSRHSDVENSRKYAVLEAEMKFWKAQADYLRAELANIPSAVDDWGYCEIKDENGKYWRLVADKEAKP